MPSEQRLHPATLLFDLFGHLKRFAFPALLVFFGASRSTGGPGGNFGRMPQNWEMWLLVPLIPAVIFSITRYLSFRLHYDDNELVIRTGLLFRNVRHIPFSRIQNVDAVENVVHRFFGVVEARVETGGGQEEEARLSVLPRAAFDEMRRHILRERASVAAQAPKSPSLQALESSDPEAPTSPSPQDPEPLLHMPLRETLLCGLLENKGMVLIGAAGGVLWETGLGNRLMGQFLGDDDSIGRSFFREVVRDITDGGSLPLARIGLGISAFLAFLLIVRIVSMVWGFIRLYDFRLTRMGEDLRTEYGLLTRVTATVPIRRVQKITVRAGPLHRWLHRATVRVETAGGAGGKSAVHVREWLAPLIREEKLPALLQGVLPGFDLTAVSWQPVHPRAFARALKPGLIFTAIVTTVAALIIGWGAIGVFMLMLPWTVISAKQFVTYLRWAEDEEMVLMRSGWIWQQTTLARVNKIQAVALHQSPFDRRAAMARVRVDTAGATELSPRIDIPYLDRDVARSLHDRLAAQAANTAFRW
jgi:putative membrane protein